MGQLGLEKGETGVNPFRKALLRDGFTQMQYSVYARHCPSKENAEVHVLRIERHLPPDGEVRVVTITDKQFERMQIFWGKTRASRRSRHHVSCHFSSCETSSSCAVATV